jgi:hypothetical protein
MDDREKLKKYNRRLSSLKAEFDGSWRDHYKEIAEYITTRKGRFLESDTEPNKGYKRTEKIINNTAERALSILTAGMYSGLTPSSRPWFRLSLEDTDLLQYQPVKRWLSQVRDLMLDVLHKSNFYTVVPCVYEEMGCFGIGAMSCESDDKTIVRFYPFTVGEYFIATDASLRVNTFYRVFWMTAVNMVKLFGEDKVSNQIKLAVKNDKTESWHQVVHMVEDNDDRIEGSEKSSDKLWRSVYYPYKNSENIILKESGYDEFPVMAPRWSVTGSEVYGRGPGMETLPDVKMLQKMEVKGLKALDKIVDPPMNAPTDLQKRGASTIPGTVNYLDVGAGQQTFSPVYQINPNLQALRYATREVEDRIKEGFYSDLFKLVSSSSDTPQKTAYEMAKRHEEKLQLLGPMVERVQPEMHNSIIDRLYAIMERKGMLPPTPEELNGLPLKVEYTSILAQAQKMIGTTAIEQVVGFVGNLASINQEIIDKLDCDETVDQYADMLGVPPGIVRANDEVEQIRKIRMQRIQQEQQAIAAQQTIEGAKSMSEIKTGENNALTQLMGSQA